MTVDLEAVGSIARAAICAQPGHRLLVGDFSGIESRVLGWIAGQQDKVEQWAKFDRTKNPDDDPYVVIGRLLGHPEESARQFGKIADLAFGYQGGKGAYANFAPEDDTASEAQIEAFKQSWRTRHLQIVQFWWGVDRAAIAAVKRCPNPITHGRLTWQCELHGEAKFLFITLPSGRRLSYPFAKIMTNRFNRDAVEFMDNSLTNGAWVPCNHGAGAYGGLWTENIVQGIARDLLAAAMLRLEAASYPVVLHVHDEIVVELPNGEGSLAEFKYLIELLPEWATGLPLAAKVRNGPRWAAEVDAPVVHAPGAIEATYGPRAKAKITGTLFTPTPPLVLPDPATIPAWNMPALSDIHYNSDNIIARWIAWIVAREQTRRNRAAGLPREQWTDHPLIGQFKFTNIRRRFDREAKWFDYNWLQPHRNDPDARFSAVIAVVVNWSPALAELGYENIVPFNAEHFVTVLEGRRARGETAFNTRAYSTKRSASQWAPVLALMWEHRDDLRPRPEDRCIDFANRLLRYYGIGTFLAFQVLAALAETFFANASDYWDSALPGPGSVHFMNRAKGLPLEKPWKPEAWYREFVGLCKGVAPLLAAHGIERLSYRDYQNCACEGDKAERYRADPEGRHKKFTPSTEPLPGETTAFSGAPEPEQVSSPTKEEKRTRKTKTRDASATKTGAPAILPINGASVTAILAASEAADTAAMVATAPPLAPGEPLGRSDNEAPDYIAEDETPTATVLPFPIKDAGQTNGSSNVPPGGSKSAAEEDEAFAQDHAGELFSDMWLLHRHYSCTRTFDYTLPDGTRLYEQRRYELHASIPSTKKRPRKRFLPRYPVNGEWFVGAGPRLVPYNWPALLRAGPGAVVFVPEGEGKVDALSAAGLLATTVVSHKWSAESIAAVTGMHVIVLADHDEQGTTLADISRTKLTPVAASVRVVPYKHLWEHLPAETRGKEPKAGEDIKDWLEKGGDPAKLLDICREIPVEGGELEEEDAGTLLEEGLPDPRGWLTAGQFCRSFLSGLVAPGDVGKTTLRLTQAIELATGRELLGLRLYGRRRVLFVCFEDDRKELHRRMLAICTHHSIDTAELKGWLFFRAISRAPKLAELDAKGRRCVGPLDGVLRRAIARRHCDLLILDPFIKLHALEESSNPDMDFVCDLLIKIAQDYNIAVDSPAHTHKGAIVAGDADARRGASAQRDAGRLDYTFTVMSEAEAKQFGIAVDERKRYMRLDKAKGNIQRAVKARWFQLASVALNNATPEYPDGDNVQAIETWEPPETWGDVSSEALDAILNDMEAEMPAGRRYSGKPQATDRAAWKVVQKYCPSKNEAQCREMIREWIKAGVLFEAKYHDPVSRKEEWGLFVNPSKRPQY
jgi:hypothetical protein